MSHGETPAERNTTVSEAMAFCMAHGQRPPSPLSESARTAQVKFRLTPREKVIFERAAQASGFKGISDYVRTHVLSA